MNHDFWYLSRAAGFTAYLLLTASVVLGLAVRTRFLERWTRRNAVFDVHRFVSILALAFTLLHTYVLLGDGYFEYTLAELSLPLLSPYRPFEVAVGVVATYALIIVIASFYLRRFIGYRAWRAMHYATFALFAGAAWHGIASGTDSDQAWARALYLGSAATVGSLVVYRVQHQAPSGKATFALRLASAVAVTAAAMLVAYDAVLS